MNSGVLPYWNNWSNPRFHPYANQRIPPHVNQGYDRGWEEYELHNEGIHGGWRWDRGGGWFQENKIKKNNRGYNGGGKGRYNGGYDGEYNGGLDGKYNEAYNARQSSKVPETEKVFYPRIEVFPGAEKTKEVLERKASETKVPEVKRKKSWLAVEKTSPFLLTTIFQGCKKLESLRSLLRVNASKMDYIHYCTALEKAIAVGGAYEETMFGLNSFLKRNASQLGSLEIDRVLY